MVRSTTGGTWAPSSDPQGHLIPLRLCLVIWGSNPGPCQIRKAFVNTEADLLPTLVVNGPTPP